MASGSFDYGKRHVEFTNRPNRRATSAGAPEIPDTPVGLMDAKYDTYTVEVDFTPNEREAGSFYTPGRTTLILPGQGGAADIVDYDDTELTTVVANLDYHVATDWKIGVGYWFEKYDFRDAFTQGSLLMPQSVYIFMKPDNGPYKAHVVFAKLSYVF